MSNVFDKESVETPLTALLNYIKTNGKHGGYFLRIDGTQLVVVEINHSTKAFAVMHKPGPTGSIDSEVCISPRDLSVILSECSTNPTTLLYQVFEPDNTNCLENGISIEQIGEFFEAYKK